MHGVASRSDKFQMYIQLKIRHPTALASGQLLGIRRSDLQESLDNIASRLDVTLHTCAMRRSARERHQSKRPR